MEGDRGSDDEVIPQDAEEARLKADDDAEWERLFGPLGRGVRPVEEWMKDPAFRAQRERYERYIKFWFADPADYPRQDLLLTQALESTRNLSAHLGTVPHPRPWLYGIELLRGYVSTSIAPGGGAKSILAMTEAIALACGRKLLHEKPVAQCSVLIYNLEDSLDEMQRRFHGICKHYDITSDAVSNRVHFLSGRDEELIMADTDYGVFRLMRGTSWRLAELMREFIVDVLIIDPFVSVHRVGEADNTAMDLIVKQFNRIAEHCNAAIHLIHHVRKAAVGNDNEADASRGASAVQNAARSSRRLRRMSAEEAQLARIPEKERERYFYTINAKSNFALGGEIKWYKLVTVALNNGNELYPHGDHVGVPVPWEMPEEAPVDAWRKNPDVIRAVQDVIRAGQYQRHPNATNPPYVGPLLFPIVGVDPHQKNPAPTAALGAMLTAWIADGWLKEEPVELVRANRQRETRQVLAVGEEVEMPCETEAAAAALGNQLEER